MIKALMPTRLSWQRLGPVCLVVCVATTFGACGGATPRAAPPLTAAERPTSTIAPPDATSIPGVDQTARVMLTVTPASRPHPTTGTAKFTLRVTGLTAQARYTIGMRNPSGGEAFSPLLVTAPSDGIKMFVVDIDPNDAVGQYTLELRGETGTTVLARTTFTVTA